MTPEANKKTEEVKGLEMREREVQGPTVGRTVLTKPNTVSSNYYV